MDGGWEVGGGRVGGDQFITVVIIILVYTEIASILLLYVYRLQSFLHFLPYICYIVIL